MKLSNLIDLLLRPVVSGSLEAEISAITADSRNATSGVIFAALKGSARDGNDYAQSALAAGASAVLSENAPPEKLANKYTWIQVADARHALAHIAAALAGNPSSAMKLCGVTGTNGKTTTTFLVHYIMKTAWHRAGMMGTVQIDDGESTADATSTTPDAVELQALLLRMKDHDCRGVAMEVSSHGIHQHRVTGIPYDACIFTNLTQDHLDYHGSMDAYFAAKKSWFDALAADPLGKKPAAIINSDDAYGATLAESLADKMFVFTYGFNVHAAYRINSIRQTAKGMEFELKHKGRQYLVRAPYIGRFNAYNVTAALIGAVACGIPLRDSIPLMQDAPQVNGRMHNVGSAGGATVFVDYAHTPDALENACRTLRELEPTRLITIFGCGGDRDKTKRPHMAEAASTLSDFCVITSDNPRSEDPDAIIRDILAGMRGTSHVVIPDRASAISETIAASRAGDIILIAGKGHETYQQFADHSIEFDDKKVAAAALRERVVEATKFREELAKKKASQRRPR